MSADRRLALAMVGAVLVGACGGGAATDRIDGWATGGFIEECPPTSAKPVTATCAAMVPPARATIDDGRPYKTAKVYEEGAYVDASGAVIVANRGSGSVRVVVVTFEDGSRRAAGLSCTGTDATQAGFDCVVIDPPVD